MPKHRTFFLTGAPLALVLTLGAAACSEAERDQAAADAEAMAEEAGEAIEAGVERAGELAEDIVESIRTAARPDARVYFVNIDDGDVVSSPVTVRFGAENITVTEAGDQTPDTGHHHLLIDATVDDLEMDMPIPNDVNHMHFGMGQTEATIELAPGRHTLQLVMGDWTHIPHEPVVASDVITITVE